MTSEHGIGDGFHTPGSRHLPPVLTCDGLDYTKDKFNLSCGGVREPRQPMCEVMVCE